MSAYDSMRWHDFRERAQSGETFTDKEIRHFEQLDTQRRTEWENARPPQLYGGDMEDVF